jgi:hypothetical protein
LECTMAEANVRSVGGRCKLGADMPKSVVHKTLTTSRCEMCDWG